MNKQIKTRGQLISKLQHMKSQPNGNSIQHLDYKDIDTICDYLLEDKKEIERLEIEKEHLIDVYTEEYGTRKNISFELFKVERALNKACEMLADFDLETHHVDDELFNKEDWKEWCMEDVD